MKVSFFNPHSENPFLKKRKIKHSEQTKRKNLKLGGVNIRGIEEIENIHGQPSLADVSREALDDD